MIVVVVMAVMVLILFFYGLNILASMSRDEDILHQLEQEHDNDNHLNSVNFFHFIRYITDITHQVIIKSMM